MGISAEEAIKKFNVELLKKLPLDNEIFIGNAISIGEKNKANLFPGDTLDNIEAKPTRAKKVAYYLQHVITPGAKTYLPVLLKVMKSYDDCGVEELADNIQAAMDGSPHPHGQGSNPQNGQDSNPPNGQNANPPSGKDGSHPTNGQSSISSTGQAGSTDDYCSAVVEMLTDKYDQYSNLPYSSMDRLLISKRVITHTQKQNVKEMEDVLKIVLADLKLKYTTKYKGLLEAMEESEDTSLIETAKRLGGSASVPSNRLL